MAFASDSVTGSPNSRAGFERVGLRALMGRLRRFVYGNPLYAWTLRGTGRLDPLVLPPDPWPGDATRGFAILQGSFPFAGQTRGSGGGLWAADGMGDAWVREMHGFAWLRDLRSAGGDTARRRARELVSDWIAIHQGWSEPAWRPDIIAERITNWLGQYEFFCATADEAFRDAFFDSLLKQTHHLARATPGSLAGADLILTGKALVAVGLCLPGCEARLFRGLRILEREVPTQILADGGHLERSPARTLAVLRHLVDLRNLLSASGNEIPESLRSAIDRMSPMIRFFRHGDGRLALFNDSTEDEAWRIDMVLSQADARGRAPQQAPHVGFQRLHSGRTLVIADCGAPPRHGLDASAHAGTLSFEMSVGKERLIVNCGAHLSETAVWRQAQRATAAHTTLTINDTNSSRLLEPVGLGRRPMRVACRREQEDGTAWLHCSHDGYRSLFGLTHHRRLYLSADGDDLRGEDQLLPSTRSLTGQTGGERFSLRFHLHPTVKASIAHGATAALIQLPSGQVWRFLCNGGPVQLENSVYLGDGSPRKTQQIVVTGPIRGDLTSIKWALRREAR